VELESKRVGGLTEWKAGGEGAPHEVAVEADVERFFEEYFGAF